MSKTKRQVKSETKKVDFGSVKKEVIALLRQKDDLAKMGKETAYDRLKIRRRLRRLGYYISRPETHKAIA